MKFIYIVEIDTAVYAFHKRGNALQLLENMGIPYHDSHRYISQVQVYDTD